LKELALIY